MKPLGKKAYGSIPHLPGSRIGTGDHHCHEGQARIATEKTRDKNDLVIVQEKLDGSNVCVAKINGKIIALTRAGYLAETSNRLQHLFFKHWVEENENRFYWMLRDGERVCGEWLVQAHGTRYNLLHEPFVPFDLIVGDERSNYHDFLRRVTTHDFIVPRLVQMGPLSIEGALAKIKDSGHGAIDPVEGVIYRVERFDKVDFLTKYVRHDKVDGKFFPENNGNKYHWNCDISRWTALWNK